jgi:hypothetical protein
MGTVRAVHGVFANATAVARISSIVTDGGDTVTTFASEVQPGWDIGGNANGGYLMAIAGRAMSEVTGWRAFAHRSVRLVHAGGPGGRVSGGGSRSCAGSRGSW